MAARRGHGGATLGIPVPAFAAALAYYDGYRRDRLPANLLQAQRDYFGAHTYQRIDKPRRVPHRVARAAATASRLGTFRRRATVPAPTAAAGVRWSKAQALHGMHGSGRLKRADVIL